MEFGKHIGKGMWGLAGRALPSLYGVGIVFFVVRTFAPEEFGVYTVLQSIFLLTINTGQSFALQPLVKYGAESDEISGPVVSSGILYSGFVLPVTVLLVLFADPIGSLLRSESAGDLLHLVALMLVVSIPRNLAAHLLQARLDLRTLFFLDAIYSLGSLAMIVILQSAGLLSTAEGVLRINLLMLVLSSLHGVWLLAGRYRVVVKVVGSDLRRTWEYGKYTIGASISFTLYSQSDALLISAIMGPVPLAVYNAAKVFTRAYDLLLQTINTLLVPVVSRAHAANDREKMTVLAEKSLLFFTLAGIAMAVVLVLAGPVLMRAIYGGKYADSETILYIQAWAGVFIPGIAVGAAFCNGVALMRPMFLFNLLTALVGIPLMAWLTTIRGIEGSAWAGLLVFAALCPTWIGVLVRGVGVPLTFRGVLRRYTDILGFMKSRLGNV